VLLDGPIFPTLATPSRGIPDGPGWVLEPKRDGWRAIAHATANGPRAYTRHGTSHHRRLPALNAALAERPSRTVLDGDLVCLQPIAGARLRCRFDRLSGS